MSRKLQNVIIHWRHIPYRKACSAETIQIVNTKVWSPASEVIDPGCVCILGHSGMHTHTYTAKQAQHRLRFHFGTPVSRSLVHSMLNSTGLCNQMPPLWPPRFGCVCMWDRIEFVRLYLCSVAFHNLLDRCSGGSFHTNCSLPSQKWKALKCHHDSRLLQELHSQLQSDHP